MNNSKGQVLVLFILLLPILLVLLSLVVDIGLSYIEKRKIEQAVKESLSYALDHLELEEESLKINITHLLQENIDDIYDIYIQIEHETVLIQVQKQNKTIFGSKKQPINVTYKGIYQEKQKIIQKE